MEPTPLPTSPVQASPGSDGQHLDLLAIFHHILAGLTAFFSCFGFIHLGIGIAIVRGALDGKNPPPPLIGWFFIGFASIFILFGWTLAVLELVAGRKLKRRKSLNFCLVIAGVECLVMPFGTVLGVFTLIVLTRPSVKSLFAAKAVK